MKIGIITVHRAYNYGSVLQCYALQEYLKGLGHDVRVIDYRQKWTEATYYKQFSLYLIWQFVKRKDIHSIVAYWRNRKERCRYIEQSKKIFSPFMEKINLTNPYYRRMPSDFDVYLIGSDQLWSFQCVGGKDKIYIGDFKRPANSRVVGYAISSGIDSLLKLGASELKRIIGNFDKLSLREEENARMINELTGRKLPVTVDPVLLTDPSMWESMVNDEWKQRNHIVIYQARSVSGNPNYLKEKAKVLAWQLQCEIVELNTKTYSVTDFVSAIKYAKYVLTTSFHAVVFSLLMETPCYAIRLGDGLDVRYVDLLSKVGLEQELVGKDFVPVPFAIDFGMAKERLKAYRQESIAFLQSAI